MVYVCLKEALEKLMVVEAQCDGLIINQGISPLSYKTYGRERTT